MEIQRSGIQGSEGELTYVCFLCPFRDKLPFFSKTKGLPCSGSTFFLFSCQLPLSFSLSHLLKDTLVLVESDSDSMFTALPTC